MKTLLLAIILIGLKTDIYAQGDSVLARNLGPIVNSKADDYAPCITRDGLTMYFVSNRFSRLHHIYRIKRKAVDSAWSEPEYCRITPNPQDHINGLALDDIGRFYFSTTRGTGVSGDVNIWEGFGLDSTTSIRVLPGPVNTIRPESAPSVTQDGQELYFSSNRNSPAGSLDMLWDIYVTHRFSDGSWSDPESLGPQINIGIYNTTPFITPDGRFLFFSSKEKRGSEIRKKLYMSKRIGPKSTDWSKAVLLPPGLNSDKDDLCPTIASNGKTMYFSSNREEGKGFELYEATLPLDIQSMIFNSFQK